MKIALIIVASILSILCLLQSEKAEGVLSLSNTKANNLFSSKKERGLEKKLSIATAVLGAIFMVLVFISSVVLK